MSQNANPPAAPRRLGLQSSVRPSFAFYNTQAEADVLI